MALQDLVGRTFAPTPPYTVSEAKVVEFAAATGGPGIASGAPADRVPATFPIVLGFTAMQAFLDEAGLDLARIVHGEQSFRYERPVRVGDVLTAALSVSGVRSLGGHDVIATTSAITDDTGALVCTTTATLVHRGAA